MQVWKQTAASFILALGVFNSFIRGLASFARMFENAAKVSQTEQAIEDRKTRKDLAAKYSMSQADIDAIHAEQSAT